MSSALMKLRSRSADPRDRSKGLLVDTAPPRRSVTQFGSVGDKNAVHAAIIKLATTGKSLDDRCTAASLLRSSNTKT